MALVTHNLFGEVIDKVQWAIDFVRSFCPPEGYYLAYSGGKDSVCVKKILDLAGVRYDTHYNVTTVDPPELVRFIISQFDGVIYDMPDEITQKFYRVQDGHLRPVEREDMLGSKVIHFAIPELTMRELIVKKQFPPTRLQRYCCERLKESSGKYRITVTGVRQSESKNRKDNQGPVVIFDGKIGELQAKEQSVNFIKNRAGGVVLNYDDAAVRRTVEHCYRTAKTIVNPIIYFTEDDVWEFIHKYELPYCKLYDEGFKRLGCVGCPMGGFAAQKRGFERWPQYRKLYVLAFEKMLDARKESGKVNHNRLWTNGEGIMRWWMGYDQRSNADQIRLFDGEDVEE